MRGKNKHLTKEHRFYIEKSLKKGMPVSAIAKDLGYSRQAIYKEIEKGTYEHIDSRTWKTSKKYGYDVGQRVHDTNSHRKGRKKKLESSDDYLKIISGCVKNRKYSFQAAQIVHGKKVCLKTLYNYIHSKHMVDITVNELPYARRHKCKKNEAAKTLPKGTSIEKRPCSVGCRSSFGHWEMDTVYSSKDDKTCLLVLSERMLRTELIFRIPDRTAVSVVRVLDRLEKHIGTPSFRSIFKTITCDNGVEFSDFESMSRSLRTKGMRTEVFFCHPYSSYERGTNENINRMIRRWIPKGDDISLYSRQEIRQIEKWINSYPRNIFAGKSSREYAAEFLPKKIMEILYDR